MTIYLGTVFIFVGWARKILPRSYLEQWYQKKLDKIYCVFQCMIHSGVITLIFTSTFSRTYKMVTATLWKQIIQNGKFLGVGALDQAVKNPKKGPNSEIVKRKHMLIHQTERVSS